MSTFTRGITAALLLALSSAFTCTDVDAAESGPRAGERAQRAALLAARVAENPALAAIADLLALERLYRHQQKPDAVRQLYTDVLGRTTDPAVQNFAQRRLARMEFRQGNAQAAEQLLKDNLARNLERSSVR